MELILPRKKDVFFDTEKLGRLYIFNFVLADYEGFHKEIGKSGVEKIPPLQYAKALVKHVCHPEDKLEEGEYRPEQPTLNDDEINLISKSEFEDFAEKYINKTGLNRRWITRREEKEGSDNAVILELGEVEHPKKDGEKWVDYLHRLAVIKEKETKESTERIVKQFAGIESFSKNLQEQIKNTFSLGESLKKSFESFVVPPNLISKPYEPPFDYSEIAKIRPFGGLLKNWGQATEIRYFLFLPLIRFFLSVLTSKIRGHQVLQ